MNIVLLAWVLDPVHKNLILFLSLKGVESVGLGAQESIGLLFSFLDKTDHLMKIGKCKELLIILKLKYGDINRVFVSYDFTFNPI